MLLMEIKALLRYTQLNISEIAHQLEFTDASHLAKFFKKYTGLAPVAYRKKYL
jgi:AraC-like DNA-binding protein